MGYGQHSNHGFTRRLASPKRERGVIRAFTDYDECARVWAMQGQGEGRCHGGRMYFAGEVIYSYGSHFPMARFVEGASGVKGVLVNSDTWGPTTSKHQHAVRSALSERRGDVVQFYVPNVVLKDFPYGGLKPHAQAIDHYRSLAKEAFERSQNKRVRESNRIQADRDAMGSIDMANAYAKFFGMQPPFDLASTPEATRLALALGDESAMVAYFAKP